MNVIKKELFFISMLFIYSTPSISVEDSHTQSITPESAQLLSDMESKIKGTLIAIANNEKTTSSKANDLYFRFESPAKKIADLGLELEIESPNNGYKVLNVIKPSLASSLSIKAGDTVIAINNIKVDQDSGENAVQQLVELQPGDQLKLSLATQSGYREVSTTLSGNYIPEIKLEVGSNEIENNQLSEGIYEEGSCGEVSVFFTPPVTRHYYSASIFKIDDNNVNRRKPTFRLTPGKHTIHLIEHIDGKSLTGENININLPASRKLKGHFSDHSQSKFSNFSSRGVGNFKHGKGIEFIVEPDTVYHIGAKYISQKRYSIRKQEYWEPVIWKVSKAPCSL